MSIKQRVIDLSEKRSFAVRMNRSLKTHNRFFNAELELDPLEAQTIAGKWLRLLNKDYAFKDGDFAILIEDVLGDLLKTIIEHSPCVFTLDLEPASVFLAGRAALWFVIDLYDTIFNVTSVRDPDVLREAANDFVIWPETAKHFAQNLNLPSPRYPDM